VVHSHTAAHVFTTLHFGLTFIAAVWWLAVSSIEHQILFPPSVQADVLRATLQALEQALTAAPESMPKQQQQQQQLVADIIDADADADAKGQALAGNAELATDAYRDAAAAAAAARIPAAAAAMHKRGTLDAAGHPITPDAAAAAAAALQAARSHQLQNAQAWRQRYCCAACDESFPSEAAFWAHCLMPHHLLQLLVRAQAQQGQGLLGLPPLHGWWRQPLAQQAAAAAGGEGGGKDGSSAAAAAGGAAEEPAGVCCTPCSVQWVGEAQLLAHLW
jgi:hypothetical protein